jgi:hypothetical protein
MFVFNSMKFILNKNKEINAIKCILQNNHCDIKNFIENKLHNNRFPKNCNNGKQNAKKSDDNERIRFNRTFFEKETKQVTKTRTLT